MLFDYSPIVVSAMRKTYDQLNERQRRFFAAQEALKLGHGGIKYIAELLGCHRRTIERGLVELRDSLPRTTTQSRKKGVAAHRA